MKRLPHLTRPLAIFALWLVALLGAIFMNLSSYAQPLNLTVVLSKWDGGWYQLVTRHGYYLTGGQADVAFFPLYPGIVWFISRSGLSVAIAGSLVSLLCFAASLVLLYRLVCRRYDKELATIVCALLCASPFSFFFGLVYTEALFLLLAVTTFVALDARRYWIAALAAGAASGTRVVGLVLGLVVVAAYLYEHRGKLPTLWIGLGLGVLSLSGLVIFALILHTTTGDALAFLHVQKYWPDRNLGVKGLFVPLHTLRHGSIYSSPYMIALVEVGTLIITLWATVYTYVKLDRFWSFYLIGTLAIVAASGSIGSINRYSIVLFPLYIALAHRLRHNFAYLIVLAPSCLLLATFTNLYVQTGVFLG